MSESSQAFTPEEWKKKLRHTRSQMVEKLDALAEGNLQPQVRDAVRSEIRETLKILKRERDMMIGCLAEESNFIDELETRLKEIERVNKRRFHLLPPAPTNGQIDFEEKRARHFAQGKSFYKLFWVFFIGCFLGVIIERLWCFVRFGVFEPRVGLIYGPFNLVYGVGAWALTMALYQFRNRSKLFSFIGGALVGSVVEYTCSWFQETVFGSVSWDYSNQPFNLNGRICLLYSIYWGLLGILWIKEIYPRMARLILRIPDRIGKPLTFVLAVFMVFNSVMTGLTALRWVNRRQGEPPRNAIEAYFDEHYPDERMQRIFSNLEFTQDDAAPVQENGK